MRKEKSVRTNFIFNALLGLSGVLFPLISFPYSSSVSTFSTLVAFCILIRFTGRIFSFDNSMYRFMAAILKFTVWTEWLSISHRGVTPSIRISFTSRNPSPPMRSGVAVTPTRFTPRK